MPFRQMDISFKEQKTGNAKGQAGSKKEGKPYAEGNGGQITERNVFEPDLCGRVQCG